MKTTLNVKGIQLGELKIEGISIEQEYSVSDAINMMNAGKQFVKDLIKDIPEMLLDLEGAFETFQEIDERQSDNARELFAELNSEGAREEMLKKAHFMAHARACQEAKIDTPACGARMPKHVKVKMVGPNGESLNADNLPKEVRAVMADIIGKIERGEMR